MANPLSKAVQTVSDALAVGIEQDVLSHVSAQQFEHTLNLAKANIRSTGTPGYRRFCKYSWKRKLSYASFNVRERKTIVEPNIIEDRAKA